MVEYARETYSKTGSHLLGSIAIVHPFVISTLLMRAETAVGSVGEVREGGRGKRREGEGGREEGRGEGGRGREGRKGEGGRRGREGEREEGEGERVGGRKVREVSTSF